MTSIHDIAAIDRLFAARRVDRQDLKRFRNAFYKSAAVLESAVSEIPPARRRAVLDALQDVELGSLELAERRDSRVDGATKLLFRTRDGFLVESVILRIATGRTSLCLSSQAGCAAACRFCATGMAGLARDLDPSEILDQAILAHRLLAPEGRRARNIVFMGMGEPFHNEEHVLGALEVLTSPRCFNYPPGRVLVSTVGIPEAMLRCARRFPGVHLALSLHSARAEVRERLVPLARRHGLDELRAALEELNALQRQPVMIEYVLLAERNDSLDDAGVLAAWLDGLLVHVNLIPYNPVPGASELRASDATAVAGFARELKSRGLRVTVRYSLGSDIAAACGQLVRAENRALRRRRAPASWYHGF